MKQSLNDYRDGVVGALLDEYEKPIDEFTNLLKSVSPSEYQRILDEETSDDNCRSIKSIFLHMVRSGYDYVNTIRRTHEIKQTASAPNTVDEIEEVHIEFSKMMFYTEETVNLFK